MANEDSAAHTRAEIIALRDQYSGLPAVPINPLQYDGWFEEVRKRMRMRSLGLTVAQETALQNQLNALQVARLTGVQTETHLQNALSDLAITRQSAKRRAENTDKIQAKQAELDLLKIDTEILKTQKQLDELKNPPAPPPLPKKENALERLARTFPEEEVELRKYPDNPDMQNFVKRYFDDKRMRIKEGRE